MCVVYEFDGVRSTTIAKKDKKMPRGLVRGSEDHHGAIIIFIMC